jgi:hypothetical protein
MCGSVLRRGGHVVCPCNILLQLLSLLLCCFHLQYNFWKVPAMLNDQPSTFIDHHKKMLKNSMTERLRVHEPGSPGHRPGTLAAA